MAFVTAAAGAPALPTGPCGPAGHLANTTNVMRHIVDMKIFIVTLIISLILLCLSCSHSNDTESEWEFAEFWADSISIWIDYSAPTENAEKTWLAHVKYRCGTIKSDGMLHRFGVVIGNQPSEKSTGFPILRADSIHWADFTMGAPDFKYSEYDSAEANVWFHGDLIGFFWKNDQHKMRLIDDFFWMDSVTVAIVK